MVIPIEASSLLGVVLEGVLALILSFAGLRAVLLGPSLAPATHKHESNRGGWE
jgi:hypothetical protein